MNERECLTAEQVSAFVEPPPNSGLSLTERQIVVDHIAACENCYKLVASVMKNLEGREDENY